MKNAWFQAQSGPPVLSNENPWGAPLCSRGRLGTAGVGHRIHLLGKAGVKLCHLSCDWQPGHTPQVLTKPVPNCYSGPDDRSQLQGRNLRLGHLAVCAVSTLG